MLNSMDILPLHHRRRFHRKRHSRLNSLIRSLYLRYCKIYDNNPSKNDIAFHLLNATNVFILVLSFLFLLGLISALHPSNHHSPSTSAPPFLTSRLTINFTEKSKLLPLSLALFRSKAKPKQPQGVYFLKHVSPIQSQLHDRFAVPWRYISLLSQSQEVRLFHLLSIPLSEDATASPDQERRLVFAHIKATSVPKSLRAMASAITYARVTSRIAVLFVDTVDNYDIDQFIKISNDGSLTDESMVVKMKKTNGELMDSISNVTDWAEWSVMEAAIPVDDITVVTKSNYDHQNKGGESGKSMNNTRLNAMNSTTRMITTNLTTLKMSNTSSATANSSNMRSQYETNSTMHGNRADHHIISTLGYFDGTKTKQEPMVGNTNIVATLDNLAVIDTHVSLTLSEVTWSQYAPRVKQEEILTEEFKATHPIGQKALNLASILGRHSSTHTLAATNMALHEKFHIPFLLLRGMSTLARKVLLLKLEAKQRLSSAGRTSKPERQEKKQWVSPPTVMFVHAQYGLGNRLRALGSALAFARKTSRILVLIWVPDEHLNCSYTDLFAPSDEFVVVDTFTPHGKWPYRRHRRTDAKVKYVKWHSFMKADRVNVLPSSKAIEETAGFHMYVSTCYVIQSSVTPFISRTSSPFWDVLTSFSPDVNVIRLVERFSLYPMSEMIGIHIRSKTIREDISGVDAKEYGSESSKTTDYWRKLTQVDTFVEEMRRQPADQLFYVSADKKEVLERLETEFPTRVFFTPRDCDSRGRDCLPFALADILLLSRCSSLRGSYWSSFSELAQRIGGARFLLAGVDFGRPIEKQTEKEKTVSVVKQDVRKKNTNKIK